MGIFIIIKKNINLIKSTVFLNSLLHYFEDIWIGRIMIVKDETTDEIVCPCDLSINLDVHQEITKIRIFILFQLHN
ncbi:hypothetical protein HZS_7546 [Henneguya salminicola]|nr:hypothetical protein HZS_7546 [Henneguya salminicola]